MNLSHVICGCLLVVAASPALAQPKDEPPFKRARLEGVEETKRPEVPCPPYGRLQILHERREALPNNFWETALTPEGQLVGAMGDGTILILDLATGALDAVHPKDSPLSELMGTGSSKVIVLQHGEGRLTAGSVLALTPDGIYRLDARARTAEGVAGLESLPPDADWHGLALWEGCEGSILVKSQTLRRTWRLDADGGGFQTLLRPPDAAWAPLSFEAGVSDAERIRVLPPGVGKPATRLALGVGRQFLAEPGGTLVEHKGLWRFDPASGVRTWPLASLPKDDHHLIWRLVTVLPDGSWVLWSSHRAGFSQDDRETLHLFSPADALQARLEHLVGQGKRAAEADDLQAWDQVLADLDGLGHEQAGADIAATLAASSTAASFPVGLGHLIADYAQAPAAYTTRLRIRLARRHLLDWGGKTGLGWEDPVASDPAQVDPLAPELKAGMAPIPAPPSLGRVHALGLGFGSIPDVVTSDGRLLRMDAALGGTLSQVDLATGARVTHRNSETAPKAGWPTLISKHLALRRGAMGFPEGTLLVFDRRGLHGLDPATGNTVPLIPAERIPVVPGIFSQLDLQEDWDGTVHLIDPEARRAWRLEIQAGALAFQEVVDPRLAADPDVLMARLSQRHSGARMVLALKAVSSGMDEPFQELKGPESLPPGAWDASVPVTTARIWEDIEGPRLVFEEFLTEPGETLAELRGRYRLNPAYGTETQGLDALSWMDLPGHKELVAVLPDGSWIFANRIIDHPDSSHDLHLFSPADALQAELEAIVGRGGRAALERNPERLAEAVHSLDVLQGLESFTRLVDRGISAAHRDGYFPPVLAKVIADYLELPWSTKLRARLARRHLDDWAVNAGIPLKVPGGAPALLAVPAPPARQEP